MPLERDPVEGGKGGSLYDGEDGLWYEKEEGRRISLLDECDVLEEALKDDR